MAWLADRAARAEERANAAESENASLRARLAEALILLRQIDAHGVLSMAAQKGAGAFVREWDSRQYAQAASQPSNPET
jgi:hypothetical protein